MQVNIESNGAEIRDQVEQLLQFFQSGLRGTVDSVSILVDRTYDPLGTALYHCHLRARVSRGADIVIDETQVDLQRAVKRSLDRCVRAVRRRFNPERLSQSA